MRSIRGHSFGFIKLTDEQGNFVYDYYLDGLVETRFGLYTYDYAPSLNESYKIETDNEKIEAIICDGQLIVRCPKGQTGFITITGPDGFVSDTVRISNRRLSCFFMLGVRMYEFYQTNGPTLNYKLLLITLFLALFVIALPNEKELHGYRGALTD